MEHPVTSWADMFLALIIGLFWAAFILATLWGIFRHIRRSPVPMKNSVFRSPKN